LFSYISLEDRVPADHPLRAIRALVEPILVELAPRWAGLYAETGRPSIPPEQLLRALLLQVLQTIRSERQLMEQLDFNLLYRWFVGLGLDEPVWHPTTFTKNRDRLLAGDIAAGFLAAVVRQADQRQLLSREHFTVDGTLLEAWASQKSYQPKAGAGPSDDDDPRNPSVNFRGQRRSNATHASTTDPDARLAKKGRGKEAKLSYQASVLTDNRHGLVVLTVVDPADGPRVEVAQAEQMLQALAAERGPRARPATVGADRGYDQAEFVTAVRALGFTPHVAQVTHCASAIDGRTTRHPGYPVSQRQRKRIEQTFGWGQTIGPLRKLRHRGRELVDWILTFVMAAYDLVRIRTLVRQGMCA
jgi:transposase